MSAVAAPRAALGPRGRRGSRGRKRGDHGQSHAEGSNGRDQRMSRAAAAPRAGDGTGGRERVGGLLAHPGCAGRLAAALAKALLCRGRRGRGPASVVRCPCSAPSMARAGELLHGCVRAAATVAARHHGGSEMLMLRLLCSLGSEEKKGARDTGKLLAGVGEAPREEIKGKTVDEKNWNRIDEIG
ncbi:unnamed protein product [Urochloa humidicola]